MFREVLNFQGNFRSEKFFPLQLEYERQVEVENEINECINTKERQTLITKLTDSQTRIREADLAIILKKILEASSAPNFGCIVRLFVQQLKHFIYPIVSKIEKQILDVQKQET